MSHIDLPGLCGGLKLGIHSRNIRVSYDESILLLKALRCSDLELSAIEYRK